MDDATEVDRGKALHSLAGHRRAWILFCSKKIKSKICKEQQLKRV